MLARTIPATLETHPHSTGITCAYPHLLRPSTHKPLTHTQGGGDTVVARAIPGKPGEVVIDAITGDGGRLSLDPAKNCIGVAATETLKLLGSAVSCGVGLTLQKVGTW